MRRLIQTVIGIVIAGAGLYFFLRGTDVSGLVKELKNTNPVLLAVSTLTIFPCLIFRTWRWHLLLPSTPGTHKRDLFSHTIIGFMINNIIPARAGEAARAMLLWKKNGFPLAASASSLIVDRATDMLVFLLMFAAPVLFIPTLHSMRYAAWIAISLFIAGVLILALLGRYPGAVESCIGISAKCLPKKFHVKISTIARDVSSVMAWTRSPYKIIGVTISSLGVWLFVIIPVVLLSGKYPEFGLLHGAFVISFAVVGAAIPLAPGYVGTLHAAVLQSLLLLGYDHSAGRALAVLVHAVGYVPVTLVGLIYFFKADISFREISHADKTIQKKESP